MTIEPGDTRTDWRYVGLWRAPSGAVRVDVLDQTLTRKKDGTDAAVDAGGFPTPYDPAELIDVPGVGPVPAVAIVGGIDAWVRAKRAAHEAAQAAALAARKKST